MPAKLQCLECGGRPVPGEVVAGGSVCSSCWQALLRTATSRLCDRLMERIEQRYRLHPVTVSRVVAAALPERVDRLRVWFELGTRGLEPSRISGKRSPQLLALVEELRSSGLPANFIGQRNLPGAAGSPGICSQCGKDRTMAGRIGNLLLCAGCWRTHESVIRACVRAPSGRAGPGLWVQEPRDHRPVPDRSHAHGGSRLDSFRPRSAPAAGRTWRICPAGRRKTKPHSIRRPLGGHSMALSRPSPRMPHRLAGSLGATRSDWRQTPGSADDGARTFGPTTPAADTGPPHRAYPIHNGSLECRRLRQLWR